MNYYKKTSKTSIVNLIVKGFGKIDVYVTQVPFLKKKKWYPAGKSVGYLDENCNIVFIDQYLKMIKSGGIFKDRNLPYQADEDIYFDKSNNQYFIYYMKENIKCKKCFSIKKYGKIEAREKAIDFLKGK